MTLRHLAIVLSTSVTGFHTVHAEESHGFLNLVNLVPAARCHIEIGTRNVLPGGIQPGRSTGWFIVPAASHTLGISLEDRGKAAGTLALAAGESTLCVVFLQPAAESRHPGERVPPRIRFKRCDALTKSRGFSLRLLSFCPQETRLLVSKRPVTARWLEPIEIPGWNGGALTLSQDGKIIGETAAEHEAGPFYLFVGTDGRGNYAHALVRAETQTLPPWMKPAKPSP